MSSNENYSEDDDKKIYKIISERFYSKLKKADKAPALIPHNYPRYFGEKFEHYRAKFCGKKLKGDDFKTLAPHEWLNDMIVNYYVELIENRSMKDRSLPKVYAFSSFFYNAYRKQGYSGIKSWINATIFDFDYILLPIHDKDRAHWIMIIVDVSEKIIASFDSLGGDTSIKHLEHVRKFLVTHAEKTEDLGDRNDGWEIFVDKTAPLQSNGYDCGVYACQYAQYITKERYLEFKQSQMEYFRKRMEYELMKGKLLKD
uniref:Ubiquitin-like protease family profile domain-containing protein n=1 Tax=Panagrolaimus sp. PS1159 TaxID=55785 RepID=A0AC35F1V1_9BILA